jgi:hypothetical protein
LPERQGSLNGSSGAAGEGAGGRAAMIVIVAAGF